MACEPNDFDPMRFIGLIVWYAGICATYQLALVDVEGNYQAYRFDPNTQQAKLSLPRLWYRPLSATEIQQQIDLDIIRPSFDGKD